MKAEDLKRALRAIIKEEVRKAVQEEVSKAMGRVLVEMVKEIKGGPSAGPSGRRDYIGEEVDHEPEAVELPTVINTKNPKLNQVLSETARNFRPLQKTADATAGLAELMEGGFDKVGQNESAGVEAPAAPATKIDFLKSMVSPSMPQQASVLGTAAVPDVLKGVFKKDFRAVMKKIDEQKKNGSPGMINMGNVIQG